MCKAKSANYFFQDHGLKIEGVSFGVFHLIEIVKRKFTSVATFRKRKIIK
jgi:hypothetical protein